MNCAQLFGGLGQSWLSYGDSTMFVEDPQVDKNETASLLAQIMAAVKNMEHVLFVVTADDATGYENIVSGFDNRMVISEKEGKLYISASTAYRSKSFAMPCRALRLAG